MELREALDLVVDRRDLSAGEADGVMTRIMAGEATPAQIGGLLCALRAKGETIDEVTGFARAMRRHAVPVSPVRGDVVDLCGTGGDGSGTFNISTTASFVVAGAGVPVAKHGNRSVSSRCGSADVLEALGIDLTLPPEAVAACIDEVGIGFLFAPRLHPAMKHAVGPRREMGVRTVFNILGPLTNPAGASIQVLGVYQASLTELMARSLRELGCRSALVVHGGGGVDEFSTIAPNRVTRLLDGAIKTFTLDAQALGLRAATLERLSGGEADENAAILAGILDGAIGPRRDVVLLNAAAALVAAGKAAGWEDGLTKAADSIDSGAATRVLEGLRRAPARGEFG